MQFTVFTPTYNRASTLPRVYASLQNQTVKDFEWLIIDDGSTDNTEELVRQWQAECKDFAIRYIYQENGHKKAAHNRAVAEACGELFIVLDSDDSCIPQAMERFQFYWNSIPRQDRDRFWCVCGLCKDADGNIVGDMLPGNTYLDASFQEVYFKYKIKGEKWGAMKTSVLRNFPFREDIPGHVPEGTVWYAIAPEYNRARFFNEPLRVYYQDVPGLMARPGEKPDPVRAAPGALYAGIFHLDNNLGYFRHSPHAFFMAAARLTRFWLHCSSSMRRNIGYWPGSNAGRCLALIAAPCGVCMWLTDRLRLLKICQKHYT